MGKLTQRLQLRVMPALKQEIWRRAAEHKVHPSSLVRSVLAAALFDADSVPDKGYTDVEGANHE